jgi:uncharacterized BrkB/YihY/UPF0761 family membrane protein
LFPLLLVVVTVLGFLLGRDSGFQQRLLGSAVADFPIIGNQVRDNIHGLRGSGIGLVIGSVAFAWGARGLTQVTQHAMAEIWNIPGRQRPGFWARQLRGLLLLVVFAVGLGVVSVLTWLGTSWPISSGEIEQALDRSLLVSLGRAASGDSPSLASHPPPGD